MLSLFGEEPAGQVSGGGQTAPDSRIVAPVIASHQAPDAPPGVCLLSVVSAQWGYNNYGYGQPPPSPNNNNLGIGYPTAYGLWLGRGLNNGGWNNGGGWEGQGGGGGHPTQGTGFGSPLRCLNGGAHIGQCRLDKDSICIALGGTCIHGACCTTPFIGLGTTTTQAPAIEGEVTVRTTSQRTTVATVESIPEIDESEEEVNELRGIIGKSRTTTTTDITPYEVTLAPEVDESRQCLSGLRAVGPCGDDSDCPTLHQCERHRCCYFV